MDFLGSVAGIDWHSFSLRLFFGVALYLCVVPSVLRQIRLQFKRCLLSRVRRLVTCDVCGHAKIYCEGSKVLVPPLDSDPLNPYCFAVRVQSNDEDHTAVPCHARLWFDQLVGSVAYIEVHNAYGCNVHISRDLALRRTILGFGWHELLSHNLAGKGDECVVAFGPSSCFEAHFHYGLHVLPYYRYMAPLVPHIVCDPAPRLCRRPASSRILETCFIDGGILMSSAIRNSILQFVCYFDPHVHLAYLTTVSARHVAEDSFVFPMEFARQINRDYDDVLLHIGYKPCGVDAWISFQDSDGARTGPVWRDVVSDMQPRVGMLCLFVFSGPYFNRLHYGVNFF
ncbi:hypothetical protein ACP70R_032479 [Stipagrostis hirtigluma subsp. patula]